MRIENKFIKQMWAVLIKFTKDSFIFHYSEKGQVKETIIVINNLDVFPLCLLSQVFA